MPWFNKPSMTRCLPMDSRLVKDHIKAQISSDVDNVEEISGAGLALNVVELFVLLFIVVAACAKSYSMIQRSRVARPAPPAIGVSNPAPSLGANGSTASDSAASSSFGFAAFPISSSLPNMNAPAAPTTNNAAPSTTPGVAAPHPTLISR